MLPDDAERQLAALLAAEVESTITAVEITRLDGGHSSGVWRIDATAEVPAGPFVLKAPPQPSPVHQRDAVREARILRALGDEGLRVPPVVAIDESSASVGRPCFVLAFVDGHAPTDVGPGSYHDDPWLQEAGPEAQRAIWMSFQDTLAALHRIDPAVVPDASLGDDGMASVFAYWRASLLDVVTADAAPRQMALLDWQEHNLPANADENLAPCMGDARLVNCLFDGTEVQALFDFEIGYIGNPAADVGYSLFMDGQNRAGAETPLPGIPSEEETWQRWEDATGRTASDRAYWKAFGAMILAITATRFMVQLGLPVETVDIDNPIVTSWETCMREAESESTEGTT